MGTKSASNRSTYAHYKEITTLHINDRSCALTFFSSCNCTETPVYEFRIKVAAESINVGFIIPTIRLDQDLEVNVNNLNKH